MRKDLNMIPMTGDLSLFTRIIGKRLAGETGAYVYDRLPEGKAELEG